VPSARVLILTTFEQDDYVFGALRAGASGFLLKRTRPEALIAAVHTIASGDALLSPSVTRRVIDRMAQQPTPDLGDQARLDELTPCEREILGLVARGLSNREIRHRARRRGVHDQDPRQADPDDTRAPRSHPDRDLRLRDRREPACRRSQYQLRLAEAGRLLR
jgi:hypothetical protein